MRVGRVKADQKCGSRTVENMTGPHKGSVSGEGITALVCPQVRPVSLLTAQYTLCP